MYGRRMSDEAVRALAERVAPGGIVLARFGPAGAEVDAFGGADGGGRFEIGSLTKLFTARLLELLAAAGTVRLDEPAAACLGPGWRLRRAITLERLAEHRSGLPRLPRRAWLSIMRDPDDPYRHLTVDDLRRSLPALPRPRTMRYSNFGYALLGHALAARAGMPWEALVRERITQPLGLGDTGVDGPVAQPHDKKGREVPPWTMGAIEGAGALRSTAADLARFARDPGGVLGWVREDGVDWHNGATGGSCAFLARRPDGQGVVLLASAGVPDELTELGLALAKR